MVADCPDVELLEAFLDGRGSEHLVEHLAECSSCAERMESLLELERDRIFAATTRDQPHQYLNEQKYEDLKQWTRFLKVNSSARVPADIPETIGRYQVRRFLGKGSFGDVYAAYDPLFDIERAVKLLRRGLFNSESSRNQFLAEARRAAKVNHPGLVDVRDVVIDPDQSFIVMKLIEGETLEKRLRLGPMDITTTVQIMTKVAQAAHHAHEAGLVHRDLKPANILLDQHENPVIADFGLVIDQKALSGVDRSMSFAGTRPYMSPEQYSGNPLAIDRRSDIWALGVVLTEMLQRQRPFPQRDDDALSRAIRAEEPVLPQGKQFTELNGVVKRCLAKNPDERYATAAELANDLSAYHFVGRQRELSVLRSAFNHTRSRCPALIEVDGGSGYGKSELIQQFTNEIRFLSDVIILSGRCYERESLPYKAVEVLVDSLSSYLRRLNSEELELLLPDDVFALRRVFPTISRVVAIANAPEKPYDIHNLADLRRRAFLALRSIFIAIARQSTLVLIIDDLHWSDVEGISLLCDLFGPPAPPPVLVIVSYRQENKSVSECLSTLRQNMGAFNPSFVTHRLTVNPLTEAESWQLFNRNFANQWSSTSVSSLVEHCNGIPYVIDELVQYLRLVSQRKETIPKAIELESAFNARLAELTENARSFLEVVALAGGPVTITEAGNAAKVPQAEALLRELCDGQLVKGVSDSHADAIVTSHDRVGAAVIASIPDSRRKLHHEQLGCVLAASENRDWELIGSHFQASERFYEACVCFSIAAESALDSLAFERAAELFAKAAVLRKGIKENENEPLIGGELSKRNFVVPDRWWLLSKQGVALGHAGYGAEAAKVFIEASQAAPSIHRASLSRHAALQLCASGHTDKGRALFREVLQDQQIKLHDHPLRIISVLVRKRIREFCIGIKYKIRPEEEIDPIELVRLETLWDAISGLLFSEPLVVAGLHAKHISLAMKSGSPPHLMRSLCLEAIISSVEGISAVSRCDTFMKHARRVFESSSEATLRAFFDLAEGTTSFLQVQMERALVSLAEAEKQFSRSPTKAWWELDMIRSLTVWAQMHLGNYHDLELSIQRYLDVAEQRGDRMLISAIYSAGLPQLKLRDDKPSQAREVIERMQSRFPVEVFQQQHVSWLYSQSQIDLYLGNGEAAWYRLNDHWQQLQRSMQLRNQFGRVSLIDLRGRSALQCGSKQMLANAKKDLERLRREPGEWIRPYASRLSAGIAEAEGRIEDAMLDLLKSQAGFEHIGFKHCAAAVQMHRGGLIQGENGQSELALGRNKLETAGVISPEMMSRVLAYELSLN